MCNPEAMQGIMRQVQALGGSTPVQPNPKAIPSLIPSGVGASTAAQNGMPPTQGGPQMIAGQAMGMQPQPQVQIPQQPAMPSAMGHAPAAPGGPTPPADAIRRMVDGGRAPQGRGMMKG